MNMVERGSISLGRLENVERQNKWKQRQERVTFLFSYSVNQWKSVWRLCSFNFHTAQKLTVPFLVNTRYPLPTPRRGNVLYDTLCFACHSAILRSPGRQFVTRMINTRFKQSHVMRTHVWSYIVPQPAMIEHGPHLLGEDQPNAI